MRYLLDTHILIWFLTGNRKLSASVKSVLEDGGNEFFFSTESIREMIVKSKSGKLTLPDDIDAMLFNLQSKYGIQLLTVGPKHLKQLYVLEIPSHHKDPFDHLLICQSVAEELTMISADRNFPHYKKQGLELLVNSVR